MTFGYYYGYSNLEPLPSPNPIPPPIPIFPYDLNYYTNILNLQILVNSIPGGASNVSPDTGNYSTYYAYPASTTELVSVLSADITGNNVIDTQLSSSTLTIDYDVASTGNLLPNLEMIYGDLIIQISVANGAAINDFNNLKYIFGSLTITFDAGIGGIIPKFNSLKKVTGGITISGNDTATNFDGFYNLYESGPIDISTNTALLTLSGFTSLTYLTSLTIDANPILTDIPNFNGLTRIDQYLQITANDELSEINGFYNMLSIGETASAPLVSADTVNTSNDVIILADNSTVNTMNRILGFYALQRICGHIAIYGNYFTQSALPSNIIYGFFALTNAYTIALGCDVDGSGSDNFGLYQIIGFTNIKTMNNLFVVDNSVTPTIYQILGFNSIQYVTDSISITNTLKLSVIDGFGALIYSQLTTVYLYDSSGFDNESTVNNATVAGNFSYNYEI
jgi:hypothetical protein